MTTLNRIEGTDTSEPMFAALLDPSEVTYYWPEIEKSLDATPALWENTTKDNIHRRAMNSGLQFWAVGRKCIDVFVMTQIEQQEAGTKTLHLTYLVGHDLETYWTFGLATAERVALTLGCDEIAITTLRPAIAKRLQREGFRLRTMLLSKFVHEGSVQ